MIQHYLNAVMRSLNSVLTLVEKLALPLAVVAGLMALSLALLAARRKEAFPRRWQALAKSLAGYGVVALLTVVVWSALKTTQPLARMDMKWREAAEATTNSIPDAPPVTQTGPALAALQERTYTRTLTLPPSFLQRIGAEGVGTLAPYLEDPTTANILRLKDTFRRSGRDVVFTRQATRLEEAPFPFADARVTVQFQRLAGRAYDAVFEGRYLIRNATDQPITAQFLFNLPNEATVRDLNVSVGDENVADSDDQGAYRWQNKLAAGETREAVVKYRVVGARSWNYDLGSSRRRVQKFHLNASLDGEARFGRGSLQPTTASDRVLDWKLDNIVTAQQVALVFPPDTWEKQGYLQVLGALPASLVLFLVGVLAFASREERQLEPMRLAIALLWFGFGLVSVTVFAVYLPVLVSVIAAPLLGAILATSVLPRRFLLVAIPTALVPAAFLSAENSGLLLFALVLATLAAFTLSQRKRGLKQ